jgi:AcrR family transcriptional regulator
MPTRARPGGRTARIRSAVLAATLEFLQESGFGALTFEAVAERAGVHRTTVHRRWASRAALVADALLEVSADHVPVPDTGRLRTDLRRFACHVRDAISTPLSRAIIAALADPTGAAELDQVTRRFWEARFAATAAIVDRAIERGEIAKRTDPRFVVEALVGPIWFRVFVVGEAADDRYVHRLVDAAIAALEEGKA